MEKKTHSECKKSLNPVRDTLDLLHGKWKLLIIIALHHGNLRFKEMQREIEGITSKMLSKELKELEMNKLVKRTVHDTMPVMVEYSLTPYGRTLDKVIDSLHEWGSLHRKRIMEKGGTEEGEIQETILTNPIERFVS